MKHEHLQPPITKRVGEWTVTVQQLNAPLNPWQVHATCGLVFHEAASGKDADEALARFADKVGLGRHDVLRAFGLSA
jgi:hypothetical protein